MKKLFTLVWLIIPVLARAQSGQPAFSFQYDLRPTVTVNGRPLLNPWAGGLNTTIYSTVRLNDDNRDDLVVFDRTTGKLNTFVAIDNPTGTGTTWQYAPAYETALPAPEAWVVFVDYDGDGKKDLFTMGGYLGGVRVFRNESAAGKVAFRSVTEQLMTVGFNGRQPLFISAVDMPAILDYDDDGDVDILTFDPTGNLISFQKNMSVERTGKKDGLDFERVKCQFWGHFLKETCNDFKFNISCDGEAGQAVVPPTGSARPMHSGNTLAILDTDGDGKKDLLFGFVSCDNLARLRNVGTNGDDARFTSVEASFPARNPVRFPAYAVVSWEDLDGDGQKDLLASSFTDINENQAFDFRASNWFYKNVGTNQKPDFQFVQQNYLQNDMLDLGENATPALADLDGDGDLDLLVGYSGRKLGTQYRGGLWQFMNMGTTQNPAFVQLSTDYLGLSLSQTLVLSDVVPSFADVDNNGSIDLVLTGTGAKGIEIRVLFNAAAKGAPAQYNLSSATLWPTPDLMLPGELPTVMDVDGDGKADVLIGKNDGSVHYFRNTGTATAPVFQLQSQSFGGFSVTNSLRVGARSLVVTDLNGDQKKELVTSAYNGQVRVYAFPAQPDQTATLLDSLPALGLAGKSLVLAAGDLDGDQLPDLMMGSRAGGLRYLKNTSPKIIITDVADEPVGPWAFPNPTDRMLTVRPPKAGSLSIMSLSGQVMLPEQRVRATDETLLDLGALPEGTYLLRLSADGVSTATYPPLVQKVVVWK